MKYRIIIKNKYQFITLNGFEATWTLSENGERIIDSGQVRMRPTWAKDVFFFFFPYKIENPKPGAEYFLRFS